MDIIIYGTGKYGSRFVNEFGEKYNILFFVDKNIDKQGKYIFDKQIKSPDVLKDYLNVPIVIAVKIDTEIRYMLFDIGCTDVRKYVPQKGLVEVDGELERAYSNAHPVYWDDTHEMLEMDLPYCCTSQLCNQSFFDMPFFCFWAKKLMPNLIDHLKASYPINSCTSKAYRQTVLYHRKLWEWVYISQALYERGFLVPGKRGVAFGVGEECTPDLFASFGCEILATDLDLEEAMAKGWIDTGQNAAGDIKKFNKYRFCLPKEFEQRVSYRDVDMNNIPRDINGYDFCWSSCALEHLGSLQNGLDFIKNSLHTIVSGGVAVHTTEYNLSSNIDTFETEGLSLYRRCDIEQIIDQLRAEGHYIYPMDWHLGNGVLDKFVDLPPYSRKDIHLRLRVSEYLCTSIGIIIVKK